MVEPVTELVLESPAGLIRLTCTCRDGKVTSVRFRNQPAFVYHLGAAVEVAGLGTLPVDVAWGGMAYVLVDAPSLGFQLAPDEARDLCVVGQQIKEAAAAQLPVVHPEHPDFRRHHDHGVHPSRRTSRRRIDRPQCRRRLTRPHRPFTLRDWHVSAPRGHARARARSRSASRSSTSRSSAVGSTRVIEELTTVGSVPAVIPSVAGQAYLTDVSQVGLDPADPFPRGIHAV